MSFFRTTYNTESFVTVGESGLPGSSGSGAALAWVDSSVVMTASVGHPTGEWSAPWPFSGPFLEQPRALAVDDGLDHREDGPLDRRGEDDFLEWVLGF